MRKTEFDLDEAFYPIKAVEHAAEQFCDICKIELTRKDGRISIRMENKSSEDISIVEKEFINYVLGCE